MCSPHEYFITRFLPVAQNEEDKFHIPASVTLAQAILESGGGKSKAFVLYNNSFGMQCKNKTHAGCCEPYVDAGDNVRIRKFKTAWEGFRAHSIHITTGKYSDMLYKCGNDPYKWADQLQAHGYSTASDYAERLKRVMRDYDLLKYDR